ncbi:MAG: hypothetical protein JNM18_25040, partial [Planctomycetaceae bacterium]|nr:hypothetical protein [Planctomycetaceae bacterium]
MRRLRLEPLERRDLLANLAPTTSGIATVHVAEDTPTVNVDLFAAFNDAEDADNALTYEVLGNTLPTLFSAAPSVNNLTGLLTFAPGANANGSSTITVRATDTGSLSVQTSFVLHVYEVNDPPTGNNDTLVNVTEDAVGFVFPFSSLTANDVRGPSNETPQSLT